MTAKILGILTVGGILLSGIWAFAERSYFPLLKGELIADSQIKSFKAIQQRLEKVEDFKEKAEAKEKRKLEEENRKLKAELERRRKTKEGGPR